jgi:hypothetical protein
VPVVAAAGAGSGVVQLAPGAQPGEVLTVGASSQKKPWPQSASALQSRAKAADEAVSVAPARDSAERSKRREAKEVFMLGCLVGGW